MQRLKFLRNSMTLWDFCKIFVCGPDLSNGQCSSLLIFCAEILW